ncbi:MAG: hypothetical protein M3004_08865 [Bacteroidota bacterium]|nr:hypothetical protein [Bacteroidota bacterium]
MSTLDLKVYETKLGEKEAETIIEYFEAKAESKYQEKKETLATKEDLSQAKVDLIKWMVGFWIVQMAAIIGLYLHK